MLRLRFFAAQQIRGLCQFSTEVIAYDDSKWFPAEAGPIQRSIYADRFEVPRCRIDQYVWANSNKWQNKIALECGVTGKSYTYAKLRDHSASFATNLQKFGLKQGDVLGICMPNTPEFIIAALGALEAGCVVTALSPAHTLDEITRQIAVTNAKLLVCVVENYETIRKAVQNVGREIQIVCAKLDWNKANPEKAINFYDWDDSSRVNLSDLKEHDVDFDEIGFMPFSSGTTGFPKGVMLSHRNIIFNSETLEKNTQPFTLETTQEQQDVFLCSLPLYHIFAWTGIFVSKMRLGVKVVTLPHFSPQLFVDTISNHKVTFLNAVPPLVFFLGQSNLVHAKHLASVRRLFFGAAPMGTRDAAPFIAKAPHVILSQGYGMTEGGLLLTVKATATDVTNCGWPTPGIEAKVVAVDDPEMKALGPNVTGELFFRGPHIMKGYLSNEKATKETLIGNGWLRSGDIGHYDEEGKFYITDRAKELIKVKGYQVAPAELEETLRSHSQIAEAAVVGVPNAKSGEVPRAFVVLKSNQTVKEGEVLEFLRGKLAGYKMPDSVVVVKAIPTSPSGKILRRQIKVEHGLV